MPAGLLLLSAVPAIGGIYRVLHLSFGGEVTPTNQRFFDSPAPIVLHGVACALFAILGAFQFTAGSQRRPRRHRLRGAIFVPCALVVGATGLWMEATYDLPAHDGELLSVFRVVFGTAMIATTLLGVRALLRRDYSRHGAWMMRTYAIGMGAGTQVLVLLPWMLLVGQPGVSVRAVLMGVSWMINVAFVEWILHRGARRRAARVASGEQGRPVSSPRGGCVMRVSLHAGDGALRSHPASPGWIEPSSSVPGLCASPDRGNGSVEFAARRRRSTTIRLVRARNEIRELPLGACDCPTSGVAADR